MYNKAVRIIPRLFHFKYPRITRMPDAWVNVICNSQGLNIYLWVSYSTCIVPFSFTAVSQLHPHRHKYFYQDLLKKISGFFSVNIFDSRYSSSVDSYSCRVKGYLMQYNWKSIPFLFTPSASLTNCCKLAFHFQCWKQRIGNPSGWDSYNQMEYEVQLPTWS